jgi:hypothetical protein
MVALRVMEVIMVNIQNPIHKIFFRFLIFISYFGRLVYKI